jgi:hypothetical protein
MEQSKGANALGYIILIAIIGLVLAFVVAFVHDLFTGQLGSSNACEQYTTQEAFESCADSVINA